MIQKNKPPEIPRVALYIRVSTEEQVLHGYSLGAQEEALLSFAAEHGLKVVGIFRDEGNSARKPALKRPVMLELLEAVKSGQVDQILFIKMDRWFRNVREYHKVQEILDAHRVTWRATMEDYNTETADGRLKVNIMLSVAENESDRTSERIKFVFDAKRRRKEAVFGGGVKPFGYTVALVDGAKRLVKDPETEHMVVDFWDHVRKYNSVRQAGLYVNEKYSLTRNYRTWAGMSRKELYTGTYRGVKDYCPAYIDHDEWEYLQQSHVQVKKTQSPDRVYIFTGLIHCPCCSNTLKATFKTYPNDRTIEYKSYRCNNHPLHLCDYRCSISEKKLEKYLLANVHRELENYLLSVEVSAKAKKKSVHDLVKLNEQMRRLNTIFMAGNLSDDEYLVQSASLKKKIEQAKQDEQEAKPPNLDHLKQFLASDFTVSYHTLSAEDKRRVWRSVISEIRVEDSSPNVKELIFRV